MHLAPLPSDANQSYERKPGGLSGSTQDTQDNFQDFHLLTPSDPQNIQGNTPEPTPTPSPSVSPTPNPSPSPTPTPIPTPTPSPSVSPTPSPSPSPSPVANPNVVISQVFGGGGNAGAPFRNDFIELFNAGDTAVDLSGWSVQYSSATAATWSVTNLTATILAPGQYYLVQEAGGATGSLLPPPEVSGTIALAATAGKVALVKNASQLTGACPVSTNIADLVGYGTSANCFEGTGPTPAPSNTNAVARNSLGCTDTGNNATDFSLATPGPRNTSSPIHLCLQSSTPSLSGINWGLDLCTLIFVLRSHLTGGFRTRVNSRVAYKEQSTKIKTQSSLGSDAFTNPRDVFGSNLTPL
ncbi:MAG: hypothetical protein DMF69_02180 [Acidobacteria bacterium]|nr:MAG: hypothetical protein DMF69_02180 [Acidobacteriota bacterium]